ncbi:hypothetical protein [Saccharopolyspora hattusasensis]|uniref:hypothetical protein n=1 Tax=Saccharopolyspora hattusasensis TaxID=1128679 RepID=UPI003D996EE0
MDAPQNLMAGLAGASDAMQGIIDSSKKGEFRVQPEAGNELIRTFEGFQDELDGMVGDMDFLKRHTPLGDSPAGQAIADFNQQVAAGADGRSYEEMLLRYQEQVPHVIEAIKKGIQLYQEVDEGNAGFGGQA